jgi:hypothetical protein
LVVAPGFVQEPASIGVASALFAGDKARDLGADVVELEHDDGVHHHLRHGDEHRCLAAPLCSRSILPRGEIETIGVGEALPGIAVGDAAGHRR